MKIGIVANILQDQPFAEALDYFRKAGIQTVEPGCGGYAGKSHVNPEELLADPEKLEAFRRLISDSGLTISALSCHGSPIHPDRETAASFDADMRDAVRLCQKLGLDTITCFSGCPGDSPNSRYPNWVTCSWPDDYLKILEYQWNDVLIPYWKEFLLWQGMNPVAVIRELKDAIYHVHAKDVKIDPINTAVNGVLDTRHYSDEINRSWIFRTIGYGNEAAYWKDIFSALRMVGYNGAVSIEHEDSLVNRFEGLEKAVRIIKDALIFEEKTEMWWA